MFWLHCDKGTHQFGPEYGEGDKGVGYGNSKSKLTVVMTFTSTIMTQYITARLKQTSNNSGSNSQ